LLFYSPVICVNFAHPLRRSGKPGVPLLPAGNVYLHKKCLHDRNRRATTLFFYYAYSLHGIHFSRLKNKHLPCAIFISL